MQIYNVRNMSSQPAVWEQNPVVSRVFAHLKKAPGREGVFETPFHCFHMTAQVFFTVRNLCFFLKR